MSSQVRLRLLPRSSCLFDEPVRLKVSGLRSRQLVALTARSTDQKGVEFSSRASYRADGSGEVHLDRDPSLGGSYAGVEPMGLLWSMRPDSSHRKLVIRNSLHPHVVKFSVHEQDGDGRLLAEAANERLLIGDGVVRRPVRGEHFQGVLFTPPGPGPFPAVLDLYVLGGGLSERRASLLATRGFVVLSLVVFGYEDLPKVITEVHLDYYQEAMQFLQKQDKVSLCLCGQLSFVCLCCWSPRPGEQSIKVFQSLVDFSVSPPPQVGSKGVGVLSLSKTGDVALSMASYLPGVEAVVSINGCCSNTNLPLYYKKKQILPPLMVDFSKMILTESGAYMPKNALHNPLAEENEACLIPIERAKAHFLFVAAEDDLNWDSKAYMEEMVRRMKSHRRTNFESVLYPRAGHFLEPPYEPHCPSSFHPLVGKPVVWGGEPSCHAAAEVHLWKKIQEFFRAHLSCDAAPTKALL
ncbi:acyl-coenzyme A thioesterase 1-like isoform X1 [Echeneis naucrates]|uniref:acyl-coenzyme A thioesterase 1-like isoform X1 n=1 Tax=Echeneis naucrates TaxID=173247 RepID=UPI00111365DF|nr:acyl-coenzyme A thioesterase 1-like isoform X1 [Echeneis naucrates]